MPHSWTAEERHMIHIARSEFNLSFEDVARLFNHLFADTWTDAKTPDHAALTTAYVNRDSAGRPQMWRDVIVKKDEDYSVDEQQARTKARSDIQRAAASLSIALSNGSDQPAVASSSAGSSTQVQRNSSGDTPAGRESRAKAASKKRAASKASPASPASPAVTRRSAAAKANEDDGRTSSSAPPNAPSPPPSTVAPQANPGTALPP